ncbi:MAG TPA: hypothetical protein VIE65_04060, partial [Methylobacter sp.]
NEPFSMVLPSKGLLVTVEDENGNKEINIIPKFSVNTPNDFTKNKKTNEARLETKACLLPYQGVLIRWRPERQFLNRHLS